LRSSDNRVKNGVIAGFSSMHASVHRDYKKQAIASGNRKGVRK